MRALIEKMRLARLKLLKGKGYADYLDLQYERSKMKLSQGSAVEPKRKEYLVGLLAAHVDLKAVGKALVVGCRNAYELDLLESHGVRKTVGVDLFSTDPRIIVMDMHTLRFGDGEFDLVYCSHALEHALESGKVLDGMARVIKPGGIVAIEVPANINTTGVEINDFRNSDNLVKILSGHVSIRKVIFKEDFLKEGEHSYCGTDGIRLIAQIK
jgi:SAM-dependent methyltransferase